MISHSRMESGNKLAVRGSWTRKLFSFFAIVTILIGACGAARAQQVAGTVEEGLAQLARAIADRSKSAERTTIAVIPFSHADGGCSVLSTYVVDELILSLFSLADSGIEIVERSQLEAIIAELSIGEGGLLNPATTKQLGNLSGVSALTIGTITIIGDLVRLNARLVATDTGKIFSAAAVTVPKTQSIGTLLGQPAPCTTISGKSASAQTAGSRAATSQGGGASASSSMQPSSSTDPMSQTRDNLRLLVTRAFSSDYGRAATLTFRLANLGKETLNITLLAAVYNDSTGRVCNHRGRSNMYDVSGIRRYNERNKDSYTALDSGESIRFTAIDIHCTEDQKFSKTGDISVYINIHKSSEMREVRFQLFDTPFESREE